MSRMRSRPTRHAGHRSARPICRYRATRCATSGPRSRCSSVASSKRSTSPRRRQNSSGSSAASGRSTTTRSTMPAAQQVERAHPLGAGHRRGVREVAVHDRAARPPAAAARASRAGRRPPGRPASAPARRRRCPGRAAAHSVGASQGDQVRAGSGRSRRPARPPRPRRDSAAPGVSMTVTSGRPSSAASRMPRRASRSAAGPERVRRGLAAAVLAEQHAGRPPKRASASSSPGSFSPCPGAVERRPRRSRRTSAAVRTPGRSGRRDRRHRLPGGDVGRPSSSTGVDRRRW